MDEPASVNQRDIHRMMQIVQIMQMVRMVMVLMLFALLFGVSFVSGLNLTINNYGFRNFNMTSQDSTPYYSVVLAVDDYPQGSYCRFCNDNSTDGNLFCRYNATFNGDWSDWERCDMMKIWELRDFYGDNRKERKYVFAQSDSDCSGGCNPESFANSSIFYDYTGISLDRTPPDFPPVVHQQGRYTNINSSIYVYWDAAYDREAKYINYALRYRVRLLENGTPITSWFDVGTRQDVTVNTPYDLIYGRNYSVQVLALNSVNMTANATSSGLFYESVKPFLDYSSDHNSSWSNDTHVTFWFNASDNISGVKGFTYKVNGIENFTLDQETESQGSSGNVSFRFPSGTYYFHIAAVDNAGNIGNPENHMFRIDVDRPSKPLFNSSIFHPSDGNITWLRSVSKYSPVRDYLLEISPDPDFTVIVSSFWTLSNRTSFDLSSLNISKNNYYIRIKSRNILGTESVFSNEQDIFLDNLPPVVTLMKPIGAQVTSDKPYVTVGSDEDASCSYHVEGVMKNSSKYVQFAYTGGKYHEAFIRELIGKSGSYNIVVRCIDRSGNPSDIPVEITLRIDRMLGDVRITKSPEFLNTIIGKSSTGISQYVGNHVFIELETSPKITGLSDRFSFELVPSEINEDDFRESIDAAKDIDSGEFSRIDFMSSKYRKYFTSEFGVTDNGDGTYRVNFILPEVSGKYQLNVKYSDDSSGIDKLVEISALPIRFSIKYINPSGDFANITSLQNIVYLEFRNFSAGLASTEKTSFYLASQKQDEIDSDKVSDQNVGISSRITSTLMFFATRSISFNEKDNQLYSGAFLKTDSPNFGFSSLYSNYQSIILKEGDILFDMPETLDLGKHTVILENRGTTAGVRKISIRKMNNFSSETREIKYTRYDSYD